MSTPKPTSFTARYGAKAKAKAKQGSRPVKRGTTQRDGPTRKYLHRGKWLTVPQIQEREMGARVRGWQAQRKQADGEELTEQELRDLNYMKKLMENM